MAGAAFFAGAAFTGLAFLATGLAVTLALLVLAAGLAGFLAGLAAFLGGAAFLTAGFFTTAFLAAAFGAAAFLAVFFAAVLRALAFTGMSPVEAPHESTKGRASVTPKSLHLHQSGTELSVPARGIVATKPFTKRPMPNPVKTRLNQGLFETLEQDVFGQIDANEHHFADAFFVFAPLWAEVAAHELVHALKDDFALGAAHVEHAFVAQHLGAINVDHCTQEVLQLGWVERTLRAEHKAFDVVIVVVVMTWMVIAVFARGMVVAAVVVMTV